MPVVEYPRVAIVRPALLRVLGPKMKTVEEMMVPMRRYPHAPQNLRVADALVMMRMPRWQQQAPDGRIWIPHVLLVFNDEVEFIGIVRRQHILQALHPEHLVRNKAGSRARLFNSKVGSDIQGLSEDEIVEGMRNLAKTRLEDIMSPIDIVIEHDANLIQAVSRFVQHDTVCLPVVKGGKLIGMLQRTDLLHEIESLLGLDLDEQRTPQAEEDP